MTAIKSSFSPKLALLAEVFRAIWDWLYRFARGMEACDECVVVFFILWFELIVMAVLI